MRRVSLLLALVLLGASFLFALPVQAQDSPVTASEIGIIGQIQQNGPSFSFVGYVTSIDGVESASLFTDSDPLNWNEQTARITIVGEAQMTSRFVLETLFSVSAEGTLTFYSTTTPASFADPASFAAGTRVAEADAGFHNLITVYQPQSGLADGAGSIEFTYDHDFHLRGQEVHLGAVGATSELTFQGVGVLIEPTAPVATINISGSLEVEEES